jgi:hypothetical protein
LPTGFTPCNTFSSSFTQLVMSAENIIINFTGDASGLQPAESALYDILKAEGLITKETEQLFGKLQQINKAMADDSVKKRANDIANLAKLTKDLDKSLVGGQYKKQLEEIKIGLQITGKELKGFYEQVVKNNRQKLMDGGTEAELQEFAGLLKSAQEELAKMGGESEETTNKVTSMKAQLRAMVQELGTLKEGTPEFEALSKKAGELKDNIGDLNARISSLGSDTKNIDGLIGIASGLAGGFAVAQGAAALFGDESEEVQKALLKVNAAMSILQGLQQIQIILQKESAAALYINRVATLAQATATNIQTAATSSATVAQRVLNVAMAASPIGIVLSAVAAIAGAVALFNRETSEAEKNQKRLNAVSERAIENYAEQKVKMEVLTDRVKKGGLSFKEKQEIVKSYNKDFGETIGKATDFKDAENKIIQLGPSYINMLTLQAEAQASFQLAVEESKKALIAKQKSDYDYLSFIDKAALYTVGQFDSQSGRDRFKANTGGEERQEEINNAEKAKADYLKIFEERSKAAQAIIDQFNFQTETKKEESNNKETAKEKVASKSQEDILKERLENKKAALELDLINLQKTGKKETQLYIDKQAEITDIERDISLVGVNSKNKSALLLAQAEEENANRQKAFNLKNAQENNDIILQGLKNQLAVIEENGGAELELKKQILDQEVAAQVANIEATVTNEKLRAAKILEITQKLKVDKKALEKEDEKKKLNYSADIAALQLQGDLIRKERELIGVKEKKQVAKINKEIQDLKLKSIDEEITLNETLHTKKLIKDEDYEKQKLALTNKRLQEENSIKKEQFDKDNADEEAALKKKEQQLRIYIDSIKNNFTIAINATLDTSAVKTALLELPALFESVYATINDEILTQAEKNKAIVSAAIAAGQQIVNQIFADSAAARQQALNEQLTLLEEQKQKELDNKNLTEQQKADIEEKYKQRERQEKIKAFNADKEAKKTQAVINGLLGITNAFATAPTIIAGVVLAALVAASTAIQVAKINSTPIPKFKHGKQKGGYEGLGIVDDGGKFEPIWRKDGSIEIATGSPKDRLTYLHRDDMVFPSMDHLYKHFSFPQIPSFVQTNNSTQQIDYDKLAEAISNKMVGIIPAPAQVHNHFDGGEVKKFIVTENTKTEIKNKYFSMT